MNPRDRNPIPRLFCFWILYSLFLICAAEAQIPTPANQLKPVESVDETLFDLFLSDQKIGFAQVRYSSEEFEILEPAEALESLRKSKTLVEIDSLLPLLKGKSSKDRAVPELGSLHFDPDTFRVVLEPEKRFVISVVHGNSKRIDAYEESTPGFGFRNDFGFLSSGISTNRRDAISHRTSLANGNLWTQADGSFLENEYLVSELSQNIILDRFKLSSGLLYTSGQQFSGATSFAGMSVDSVDALVSPDNSLRGSELEVYVPTHSNLKVYRGSQLIHQQDLEFGRHQIQTNGFPQGSYILDLVITDRSGNVTQDSRFFSSSGLLALPGYPALSLKYGKLRRDNEILSDSYYQAGTAVRVLTNLQVGGQLSGTDTDRVGTLSSLGVFGNSFVGGGFSLSNHQDKGFYGLANGTFSGGYRFSGNYEKRIPSPGEDPVNISSNPQIPVAPGLTGQLVSNTLFNRLSNEGSRYYLSAGRSIGSFDLDMIGEEKSEDGAGVDPRLSGRRVGPRVRWRAIAEAQTNLTFEVSYNFTGGGRETFFSVNFQQFFFPWTATLSGRTTVDSKKNSGFRSLVPSLRYQDNDRSGFGTTAAAAGDYRDADTNQSYGSSHQLTFQRTSPKLAFGWSGREYSGLSDHSESVYANSSIIVAPSGAVTLSAPPRAMGTVVVSIAGDPQADEVAVAVNGQTYSKVKVGSRIAIGLAPYQRYEITLRAVERAEGELGSKVGIPRIDQNVYKFVSLPGSVGSYEFIVDRVFIFTGRILDRDGNPITNRRIHGPQEYSRTDESGFFQVEITGREELYVLVDEIRCMVKLPEWKRDESFHDFGDLVCEQ